MTINTTTLSDTFTLDVDLIDTAAPDPPVIRNNTGDTIGDGAEVFFFTDNLELSDPDTAIDNLVFTITSLTGGVVLKRRYVGR